MRLSSILGQQLYPTQGLGGTRRMRHASGASAMGKEGLAPVDKVSVSADAMAAHNASRVSSFDPVFSVNGATVSVVAAGGKGGESFTMLVQQAGKEDQLISFSGDVRLNFDDDGNVIVKEGAEALENGVLKAQQDGDVLIRTGASEVDSGDFSTTVVSLAGSAATYKGGTGTTSYVGTFNKSTIEGGSGNTSFYGVFSASSVYGGSGENSFIGDFSNSLLQGGKGNNSFKGTYTNASITGGNGNNTYEGRYAESSIEGGAGIDSFLGDFIANSILKGNEGNDVYTGRFGTSILDGGAGDDVFGQKMTLDMDAEQNKYIIQATLADSTIIGGEGNDTVEGVHTNNTVDLGEGDNSATGIFVDTTLRGGSGVDTIKAYYAKNSLLDAAGGDNSVHVATAINSQIFSDNAANSTQLGLGSDDTTWMGTLASGGSVDMSKMVIGEENKTGDESDSVAFGTILNSFARDAEEDEDASSDSVAETLASLMEVPATSEDKSIAVATQRVNRRAKNQYDRIVNYTTLQEQGKDAAHSQYVV